MKSFIIFLFVAVLLSPALVLAAPACGGSVPCECGSELVESYTLTDDISNCPNNGIDIRTDNVVLDCNQHSITGTDTATTGVYVKEATNVTIKNCVIEGYSTGMLFMVASGNYVSGNNFSNNSANLNFGYYASANTAAGNFFHPPGLAYSGHYNHNAFNDSESGNYWWDYYENKGYPSSYIVFLTERGRAVDYKPIWTFDEEPTLRCGQTITQDYQLGNDLHCSGTAVDIKLARGATFDCQDHTISGSGSGTGIRIYRSTDAGVQNCNITNFSSGIYSDLSSSGLFVNNSLTHNNAGIIFYSGNQNIIQSNRITNSSTGLYFYDAQSYHLFDNYFAQNDVNAEENGNTANNAWNNSVTGNYWDDFENNIGYPSHYVIAGPGDGIDYRPQVLNPDDDGDGVPNDEDYCPNTTGTALARGCSCDQILELKPGKDRGPAKNSCSSGTLTIFNKMVGWARDTRS